VVGGAAAVIGGGLAVQYAESPSDAINFGGTTGLAVGSIGAGGVLVARFGVEQAGRIVLGAVGSSLTGTNLDFTKPVVPPSKLPTPSSNRLGDLDLSEIKVIQGTADQAGAPLEIVGSMARGARGQKKYIVYLIYPGTYPTSKDCKVDSVELTLHMESFREFITLLLGRRSGSSHSFQRRFNDSSSILVQV
jgi:hypothetical protein